MKKKTNQTDPSRRRVLKAISVGGAALAAGGVMNSNVFGAQAPTIVKRKRPNILLIMSDQERGWADLPSNLGLNAHEWLMERGVHLENFNVNTTPCSPSRSNIYTGQHTQLTKMTTNVGAPPFPELATDVPTIGHMLRKEGYYTAYKGKWHLSDISSEDRVRYGHNKSSRDALEPYGFSDNSDYTIADGATWSGYRLDGQVASEASQWLSEQGTTVKNPWFLAVNFVNPHDIVFFDDVDHQQSRTRLDRDFLSPLLPPPVNGLYAKYWDVPMPKSFYADDLSGKPWAQTSYVDFCNACYGKLDPKDERRWRKYQSYYFNCIRDVDSHVLTVLQTLENLKLDRETIIIYTADHGDMLGAHQLRQKGPFMYKENVRVPFFVAHPDVRGGTTSQSLGSAIDIAPTILGFAGVKDSERAERYPALKGVNLAPVIQDPKARTARDTKGHLYDYNSTLYVDPDTAKALMINKENATFWNLLKHNLARGNLGPVMTHPGLFRGVFDGRYKLARYFAPNSHHIPKDWDTLLKHNQLELYDTLNDPNEIVNLAAKPEQHKELILSLNKKINALIMDEIGFDDGREHAGPTFLYQL
ncbi:sulfatase-like hydrolase/transferase [Stenotrophobium rhamnosiphilum]|uniref:Sulfatase n=1 Tax=Stenotrophobium rhamnosiphilum TaxID=2029166 RepID=A0A2T5MBE5_9GAMM|nr:sulfatase-like hydrolase/transferase [Stenotrophobium rhamnosiphilum]PTU29069.1 sulfatase [Stenotrophobium rhamnosiphilum]